ncbi:MAG: FimV/HubP family polar landmark protein, partial [Gammaproteobacteria bacterium]
EAATKLDLAKAYIELGDSDSAKTILDEVVKEGTEEQKQDAQELLKQAT